jgi:hypothetical protein
LDILGTSDANEGRRGGVGVLISPNDLRWKGDHIELQMGAEQVRSIL